MSKKFNLLTGEVSEAMPEDHFMEGCLNAPYFYFNPGAYMPLFDHKGKYAGFYSIDAGFVHATDAEKFVKDYDW